MANPRKKERKIVVGAVSSLNFQIGYEAQQSNDEENPSKPEEPTLQKAPVKTEQEKPAEKEELVEKQYGRITSYEQWLERECKDQRRITESRKKKRRKGGDL